MDYQKAAPGGVRALCAYCIDMHSKDLRAQGESEQRLYELDAWQEFLIILNGSAPPYCGRKWSPVANNRVPDAVYEQVRQQFDEAELANLTFVIAAINVWNRILISSRREPGSFQPHRRSQIQNRT